MRPNLDFERTFSNYELTRKTCSTSKMAEIVDDRACFSGILVNSKGNNEASTCKMCKNYEKRLNEALHELNSVQTFNRLLQKELVTYTAHTGIWGVSSHRKG